MQYKSLFDDFPASHETPSESPVTVKYPIRNNRFQISDLTNGQKSIFSKPAISRQIIVIGFNF